MTTTMKRVVAAWGLACLAPLTARADGMKETMTVLEPHQTVIVFAGGNEKAARLLQKYLSMACGVTEGFEVASEADAGDAAGRFVIAVGPTRWIKDAVPKDLARDGYVIRRAGDVVSVCGGSDRGTFHGAVGVLDRFAGVRFYMPGDRWVSLPADQRVTVPGEVAIRSEPFVTGTSMSGLSGRGAGAWAGRNAANTRAGLAGTHQHNMNNEFPPERYAEKYPELYPIIDGKRRFPQGRRDQRWNPCFTAEQTLDAAEEMALEYFKKHPEHYWFSMGLQDSHEHCQCPGCLQAFADLEKECIDILEAGNRERLVSTYSANPGQTLDDYGNRQPVDKWARPYALSQLQWRLINRLAKRLEKTAPGKYVEAMCYGVTSFAPRMALHPNAMIFMQIHVSDNVRGLMVPRADGTLPLDAFIDATKVAIGNHEWYRGTGYMAPRIYSDYWSKFMRHFKAKGKTVNFQHSEAYANWGMDGPKYWVLAQTWWDPDREPAALWRQFCGDMFGPAGEAMYRYFRTLERWYMQQSVEQGHKWKIGRYDGVFRRPNEAFDLMREARGHLEAARGLVRTDRQRERIGLFDKCFHLTEAFAALGVEGLAVEASTPGGAAAKHAAVEKATAARAEALKAYFRAHILNDEMALYPSMRTEEAFAAAMYRVRFGKTMPKPKPVEEAPDGEEILRGK